MCAYAKWLDGKRGKKWVSCCPWRRLRLKAKILASSNVTGRASDFTIYSLSCPMSSRICAFFKVYSGERSWKAIGDRLQRPHYLSRVDQERKIRGRRKRTDIGKYSFVNRTIQHWNQLPAEVLETLPCKTIIFKERVRKVIIEVT